MAKFAEHKANVFSVMGVKTHLDEVERGSLERGALGECSTSVGWEPLARREKRMIEAILKHDFKRYPDYYFDQDNGYEIRGGAHPSVTLCHLHKIYFMDGGTGGYWAKDALIYGFMDHLRLHDYRTGQEFVVDLGKGQKLMVDNPEPSVRELLRGMFYAGVRKHLRK